MVIPKGSDFHIDYVSGMFPAFIMKEEKMMLQEKMLGYEVKAMNGLWRMKENVKEAVHDFFTTEDGDTNFISIIIVLVIVIALAALFRNNIKAMVQSIWTSISTNFNKATNTNADIQTDIDSFK